MNMPARGLAAIGTLGLMLGGTALPSFSQDLLAQDGVLALDEVVITASGFAQQIADAPATVTVISGKDIEAKSYSSITDVMRDVPGVIVGGSSSRSGAESISIRGLGEAYVLTLVDGKPVGNSQEATYNGFGSGISSTYLPPPSAIERIEVIRGPMSSLYGSAASGGVINIITKPVADQWSGSMTLGNNSYARSGAGKANEGRFYLSGPVGPLGLSLFGSRHDRHRDDLVTVRRGVVSHQEQDVERTTLGGKLGWAIDDRQDLQFEVIASDNETTTTSQDGTKSGVDAERMNYALTHNIDWGNDRRTTSFLTYEDVDFVNGSNVSGYEMWNFNTKTNLSLDRHELTLGFDYRDETTRHSPQRVSVSPVMSRWHWAMFAEDNYRVTDDLTLTLGARYDRNERYGSKITPRVYAVWHATDTLTFKGGVSGGYKTPTLKQADSNIEEPSGGDGTARDRGNSDLKPEESTNYEVGLVWDAPAGFQLGLTTYHTRFTNKIVSERICDPANGDDCGPYKWINQYQNRDEAELNGIEATLDYSWGDVDVRVNYTYADSKVTKGKSEGRPFNNNPRHVVNLGLGWQANDALALWANAQYRSDTFDTGSSLIEEHTLVDVGMDYDFTDQVRGSLAVYNLGDKVFGTTNYNDGRRVYMGLTSTF